MMIYLAAQLYPDFLVIHNLLVFLVSLGFPARQEVHVCRNQLATTSHNKHYPEQVI